MKTENKAMSTEHIRYNQDCSDIISIRGESVLVRRWRQFTTNEKLILLTLFAVLLPTVILFIAQFRALSDLREKSKAAFEYNLRQSFFEIENKTHDRLLEKAADVLQDFPADVLQPRNSDQIKLNLSRILRAQRRRRKCFRRFRFFQRELYRRPTGSIAWAGAVAWNRYDNDIAPHDRKRAAPFQRPTAFRNALTVRQGSGEMRQAAR